MRLHGLASKASQYRSAQGFEDVRYDSIVHRCSTTAMVSVCNIDMLLATARYWGMRNLVVVVMMCLRMYICRR